MGLAVKPYKLIEHTADIGIEVVGKSLQEIFIGAAKGVVDLIAEGRRVEAPVRRGAKDKVARHILLKANIKEQLLVKWLEELLYLFETRRLVPVKFKVRSLSDKKIDAEIISIPFDFEIHRPRYQIKAVTYHDLSIEEEKGRFKTRIIFDI